MARVPLLNMCTCGQAQKEWLARHVRASAATASQGRHGFWPGFWRRWRPYYTGLVTGLMLGVMLGFMLGH